MILAFVSRHPELIAERQPGGRVYRALARDSKLRGVRERSLQTDGNYGLTDEVLSSFRRVFIKTVQGLFFGLYHRIVASEQLAVAAIEDRRFVALDEIVNRFRPSPLHDITDEPLSEITANSWHSREPVITMQFKPISGGPPIERMFRLTRETSVEWVHVQPSIFSFAFVKSQDGSSVCVIDLWETLVIAVTAPWPDDRGPLRRGRKNPLSRDIKHRSGKKNVSEDGKKTCSA